MDKPIIEKSFNEDLDIGKKLDEGGIHARIYLGVQGTDMEASKKALENTIFQRLRNEENISLLEVKMFDILKEEGEFFSGVSEIEFIADEFRWFAGIIMKYGPSAVEIIEPQKVTLDSPQMHSLVADIADFTHMYSQQIMEMLKNPERQALLQKILEAEN